MHPNALLVIKSPCSAISRGLIMRYHGDHELHSAYRSTWSARVRKLLISTVFTWMLVNTLSPDHWLTWSYVCRTPHTDSESVSQWSWLDGLMSLGLHSQSTLVDLSSSYSPTILLHVTLGLQKAVTRAELVDTIAFDLHLLLVCLLTRQLSHSVG